MSQKTCLSIIQFQFRIKAPCAVRDLGPHALWPIHYTPCLNLMKGLPLLNLMLRNHLNRESLFQHGTEIAKEVAIIAGDVRAFQSPSNSNEMSYS